MAKKVATPVKTKMPTGLSITREENVFTFTWKIGDSNYSDGQQLEYRVADGAWTAISIGATATTATWTMNKSQYYPTTSTIASSVSFRVRGNRKKYKKKRKTINPAWSDWAEKTLTLTPPKRPEITASLDSEASNKTTFNWSMPADDDQNAQKPFFTNYEWQTALVTDSSSKDGTGVAYGSSTIGSGDTGYTTQTEDTSVINDGHSHTRWVRVRSRGAGGASSWAHARHVYARPNPVTDIKAEAKKVGDNTMSVMVSWKSSQTEARPIDEISIEYSITTPASGMNCPSNASWTVADTVAYKDGTDKALFYIQGTVNDDEVLFVRVTTKHDAYITPCDPVIAVTGGLSEPSGITVQTNNATHRATITATNNSSVPDSFLAIIYRGKDYPNTAFVVGVIPHGQDSVTVQCPDWTGQTISFGLYAVVGTYTAQARADGVSSYTIAPHKNKPLMTSETSWEGGSVPVAPTGVTVSATGVSGTVRVTWNWSWDGATGAELSWADHEDAWESTDAPDTFEVSNVHSGQWNISGLATGNTWYVRVRLYDDSGDATVYSPYSDMVAISLSSAPTTPTLILSDYVVPVGGTVTASWAYASTDGTNQSYAEICVATVTSSGITYGDIIARTETAQHIEISTDGLTAGQVYNLCVRVLSGSGSTSDWSAPIGLRIATPININVTTASIVDGVLSEMPIELNITGAGNSGTTTVAIERAVSYFIDRPDESRFAGHEGETVALVTRSGEGAVTIGLDDLIGDIDDGARYRIVVTVKDSFGQTADYTILFDVHWSHQALMPFAEATADEETNIALIVPVAPDGALSTDKCDIYRLSADRPQLIVKDGVFGETYVDPYPAIGEYGGYRVVFKTANGDYITADDKLAWIDVGRETGNFLDADGAIIDFGTAQIEIDYNLAVSHSWSKDFKETQYLGGSVQGDWNPAISRTASISTTMISLTDADEIEAMRRLAAYPNICHVRTPDGSSFAADVQVSEERPRTSGKYIANYSLTITRVDSQMLDGMTLEQYEDIFLNRKAFQIVNGRLQEMSEVFSGYTFSVENGHLIMSVSDDADSNVQFELDGGNLVVDINE